MIALAATAMLFAAAVYFSSCKDKKSETPSADSGDSVTQVLARGEYLAHHVALCMDCHSIRDTGKFSLPVVPGTEGGGSGFPFGKGEGIPGEVTPPNITPFALKDWSDEELVRAITRGVNKKGDTLFPVMPYHHYSKMTKSDILSIVAYIRSLKPIERTTAPRNLEIPMSMLGPLPDGNLDNNTMPDGSDKVKYGEYLVNAAVCSECHTPMGPQGPDFSKLFAGGFVFQTPMFKVAVANITPDSATGIGAWTEESFIKKFRSNASSEMVNRYPGKMNSIMPWTMYGTMKEDDLKAIYAYLRTVKPVTNKVEKYPN